MTTIFLASDHHFSHDNIRRYSSRPFESAREMDEAMIERHNAVVKPQDHVYFLGDVAMKKDALNLVRRMNGHKRLIFGNHDIFDFQEYVKVGFQKLMSMRYFDGILCTHVPIHPGSMGRFKLNVHGHTHNNVVTVDSRPDARYLNVSVERINYTPVSLEEIRAKLA